MSSIPPKVTVSRIAAYWLLLTSIGLLVSACATTIPLKKPSEFSFVETTIDDIHAAIKDQAIDCEAITNGFLNRIKKYDEISNLNSIIYINPDASIIAKSNLREWAFSPLRCVFNPRRTARNTTGCAKTNP